MAVACAAPSRQAPIASTPDPQPTSRTVAPSCSAVRTARSRQPGRRMVAEPEGRPGFDPTRRSRRAGVERHPRRADHQVGVDPHRFGVIAPGVGDGLVDLDQTPRPTRQRPGRQPPSTAVGVVADRRPQLDVAARQSRSSMATTPSDHRASEASSTSAPSTETTRACISRCAAATYGTTRPSPRRWRRRRSISSRRARPSLITAGVPTARAPDGTIGVVEHDCVGGDDGPAAHDDSVQDDRAVADEAPRLDRAAPRGAPCGRSRSRRRRRWADRWWCAARSCPGRWCAAPMRISPSSPRSTAPGQIELFGADGDGADDHGVGMDVRIRMDGGNLVAERVDGHGIQR